MSENKLLYYIITYDLLKVDTDPDCDNSWTNNQFQEELIKILCSLKVNSIEWVNATSITISSNHKILNGLKKEIDSLGICIDYFIALIATNKDNQPIHRKKITQVKLVRDFRSRVKQFCNLTLSRIFTSHIP